MSNVIYEAVPNSTVIGNGLYSRDISVEKAALDVMANAYQTKKPLIPDSIQTKDMTSAAPNPFSGSGYPTTGTTPIVQNMSEIPVGNQVAPGINEVNSNISEFHQVPGLENPVDLMVNNQGNQDASNVVSPFQGQTETNSELLANQYTQKENIDEQMQALVGANASEEQVREVVLEKIGAVITNYVDFLGRKTAEDLAIRKAELDRREAELNVMRQEIEAKLSSQFGMPQQTIVQQPMMQQVPIEQPIMQQQPIYPTQQNIITEYPQGTIASFNNQINNGGQFPMQSAMGPYQQQETNAFRQVA